MKHQWEKSQRSARGGAQRYPSLPNKKTPPQENRKQEHKKEKEAPRIAANTVEKTGLHPLDASAQLMDSNAWSVVKAIRTRLTSSKETEIEENSGHCSYQNRRCWRARRIQQRASVNLTDEYQHRALKYRSKEIRELDPSKDTLKTLQSDLVVKRWISYNYSKQ